MVRSIDFLSYNSPSLRTALVLCFALILCILTGCRGGNSPKGTDDGVRSDGTSVITTGKLSEPHKLSVKDCSFQKEGDRIIALAENKSSVKKIEIISSYFLGRKYRPDTKKRIKKQREAEKSTKVKGEATNSSPQQVTTLATSFLYLDCMTYVEHVLALASVGYNSSIKSGSDSFSPWKELFLNRLIDVMFDAKGEPLMNHMRSHFVSMWARRNAEKGYVTNIARGHKYGKVRKVILNKVKENRTFYVEDAFMIFSDTESIYYFTVQTLLDNPSILKSGDVLALVCSKEGLDVVHMGFFIKKSIFRHASYSDNKVIDSDFASYMKARKNLVGLMVLRPVLKAKKPHSYEIADQSKAGENGK